MHVLGYFDYSRPPLILMGYVVLQYADYTGGGVELNQVCSIYTVSVFRGGRATTTSKRHFDSMYPMLSA